MKKILIIINEYNLPLHISDFVHGLAKKETFKVNGVFLGNSGLLGDSDPVDGDASNATNMEEPRRLEEDALLIFRNTCESANLNYHVHVVRSNHLETLVEESAFADLVISDQDMDLSFFSISSFIASAHCPVLLVPKGAVMFTSVILAYDGNTSSIHAMKQFAYLFPWCYSGSVSLLSVLPSNIIQMEYDALIREWVSLHFPKANIFVLRGDVKDEISLFINQQDAAIVVMGAFGRSAFSRLFKESLASVVLKETRAPVFIAHPS